MCLRARGPASCTPPPLSRPGTHGAARPVSAGGVLRKTCPGLWRTVSCSLFFFYNAQGCPRLSAAASGSVLEVKSRKGRFGNGRQGEGRSHSLPAQDRGRWLLVPLSPQTASQKRLGRLFRERLAPSAGLCPLAGLLHARPSLVVSHPAPMWKDVIVLMRAPVATGPRGAQGTDLVPLKRDPRANPTSGLRFGPRACVPS